MMVDKQLIETLKSDIPLDWFVEQDIGAPQTKSGKWRMWPCPLHGGQDANFGVNTEKHTATCFSHACIEGGDIFLYIMLRQNVSFTEAVKILQEKTPLNPIEKREPPPKAEVPQKEYLGKIYDLLQFQNFAEEYLEERGINPRLAKLHDITVDNKYYYYKTPEKEWYPIKDEETGKWFGRWFEVPRLIIPAMMFGKIGYVQSRRIDKYIEPEYEKKPLFFIEILEDMSEKKPGKQLDLSDVFDRLSKRYRMWPKPNLIPFNMHRIVTKKDGKFFYPQWTALFVVEGELDALSLESAGFPAIGVRSVKELPKVVTEKNNVKMLYVIAENDPIRYDERTGLYVQSGDDWAERVRFASKHPNVTIIHPPEGCKDANDALKKGKLINWLERYGVKPLDQETMDWPLRMAKS